MFKNSIVAALILAGIIAAPTVQADDTGLMIRARAVNVDFNNGQKDGLDQAGLGPIEAKDRWIPEVDFSYFFTKNIAAELVLTYPQTVDITASGAKVGKIKALPPSLMAQYHFTDFGAFKPYVGLGLNYTLFMSRDNIGGGAYKVDQSSFGLAAQIGFDYMFTKNIGLNVDVKYIQMETDVSVAATGAKVGTLDLSPITAGVGVTYKF